MTPYTIQSILPLYLGQKVRFNDPFQQTEICIVKGVRIDPDDVRIVEICTSNGHRWIDPKFVKLILRPLSSMTEEEKLELYTMGFTHNKGMQILHPSEWKSFTPEQFKKLLEWGLDIFRLKEKGLCLYPEEL